MKWSQVRSLVSELTVMVWSRTARAFVLLQFVPPRAAFRAGPLRHAQRTWMLIPVLLDNSSYFLVASTTLVAPTG